MIWLLLGGLSSCTPPPEEIQPFSWVKVLPADGRVFCQFRLKEDVLTRWGNRYGHFKLLRAQGEDEFTQVAEFGPVNPLRATWFITDSGVTNSTTYRYVLQAVFALLEDPDALGCSDTFTCTPQAGLADPRPPAVDSLAYVEPLVGDTVELTWKSPPGHDSLYYLLLYSHQRLGYTTYEENFDADGRYWDQGRDERGVYPVKLDSAYYKFLCDRDGQTRVYKVVTFVDSVISYPSQPLEIEHTWQPD